MQIILCVISVLFGGLSLAAAVSQLRTEKNSPSALIMITGSAVLIAAVVFIALGQKFDVAAAIIGCAGICAAAIMNGLKSKQLHIRRHIIRIALSVILIIGFSVL